MSVTQLNSEAAAFLSRQEHQMLINGKFISGQDNDSIPIVNPADEKEIGKIEIAGEATVNKAVNAAYQAFNSNNWNEISPAKREILLNNLANLLEEECETLAHILTTESGKLLAQAKSEIMGAVATFRYYAGWPTKIEGETIDISLKQKPGDKNFAFTLREPVGVVAAIVPWNFPISIASWKLAPALAAGCTVVLKPSEAAPLSSLYFAGLFEKAGFPDGVVNVITGDGSTGALLTQHPLVSKITFTGSTRVGKLIGKAALDNMTGISLELGGKSPGIVFADADIKAAAKGIALGIFRNSGQVCVAGSRVYVEESIMDQFVGLLCSEAESMHISDGFDSEADIGPLVSKSHYDNVRSYIEKGKEEGATLCTGGNNPKSSGYFVEPTIFKVADNSHTIVREEIFGPVLVVIPFSTKEEAVSLANDSIYGLSSTVWSKDISKVLYCINKLDAGWVFANSPARSDPHFPLGGNKQSGNTRELGKTGVYNYTKLKAVNIVY